MKAQSFISQKMCFRLSFPCDSARYYWPVVIPQYFLKVLWGQRVYRGHVSDFFSPTSVTLMFFMDFVSVIGCWRQSSTNLTVLYDFVFPIYFCGVSPQLSH